MKDTSTGRLQSIGEKETHRLPCKSIACADFSVVENTYMFTRCPVDELTFSIHVHVYTHVHVHVHAYWRDSATDLLQRTH